MRLLKLKLRGAIGVKKGQGVDEIEIDFTGFGAGLVALTGRNGSGKTTILENLHPYRCMVSRDGSLQSHFFLKDSYRSLDFEYDGRVYRSKILIDGLTGKSEAYLLELKEDTTFAINDGKLVSYDEEIEKLLGSPDLFFNSVFSGQKSKGIAELKAAERRKLFYELLNLNAYDVYFDKAKTQLKAKELELAEKEGTIKALTDNDLNIEELKSKQLSAELDWINANDLFSRKLSTELAGIEKTIKETEFKIVKISELIKLNNEYKTKINELQASKEQIERKFKSEQDNYESDIKDCEIIIEGNAKLLSNKNEIETAINTIKSLERDIEAARNTKTKYLEQRNELQKQYSSELNKCNVGLTELNKQKNELNRTEDKILSHKKELERIRKDSQLIDEVPCDETTGSSCKFLLNAYQSRAKITELQRLISEYQSAYDANKSELEQKELALITSKQMLTENYELELSKFNLTDIDSTISSLSNKLNNIKAQRFEKLHEQLLKAKNEIELFNQKRDNRVQLFNIHKQNYKREISRIDSEFAELNNKIHQNIEEENLQVKRQLGILQLRRQNILHDIEVAKSSADSLKLEIEKIKDQIKKAEGDVAKIEALRSEIAITQNEIKDWTFLCKAFDKTGIPVLKLENSGIEITSIANELLSIFDNKFRIVFETTKLKADKKSYKESFDINIIEDDGVCEISNKSGGQQVWLETAIQLAISLVVRNQGRNIQTAFLDEKDGALDLNNAYSYIEMLRKAHRMSGVCNTFIITHRPELLDFIPQQVKLTDGYFELVN